MPTLTHHLLQVSIPSSLLRVILNPPTLTEEYIISDLNAGCQQISSTGKLFEEFMKDHNLQIKGNPQIDEPNFKK